MSMLLEKKKNTQGGSLISRWKRKKKGSNLGNAQILEVNDKPRESHLQEELEAVSPLPGG